MRIGENWWESYELNKLDMSNNQLTSIPKELATQEQLQHINLNSNILDKIPGDLFSLILKFLDLSHNKLTKLPDNIGS